MKTLTAAFTLFLVLAAVLAGAAERAVEMIETPSKASLQACTSYLLFDRCEYREIALPKWVSFGDRIEIRVEGKATPEAFDVRRLRADPDRGLCWIGDSERPSLGSDTIIIRGCRIVPPQEAQRRRTIGTLAKIVGFLGTTAGLTEVCARSPKLDAETSLQWTRRSLDLHDLSIKYAKHLAPGDEAAEIIATISSVKAAADQHMNPERIWDDPKGCADEMTREIEMTIAEAKNCLKRKPAYAVVFLRHHRCSP